jgi:flagellar biosynthesis/type III secretory pathway protein FliH
MRDIILQKQKLDEKLKDLVENYIDKKVQVMQELVMLVLLLEDEVELHLVQLVLKIIQKLCQKNKEEEHYFLL